jgi:hypothetical protein
LNPPPAETELNPFGKIMTSEEMEIPRVSEPLGLEDRSAIHGSLILDQKT